jgi:hypothetical protein
MNISPEFIFTKLRNAKGLLAPKFEVSLGKEQTSQAAFERPRVLFQNVQLWNTIFVLKD